jgi:hypothetical protein
VETVQQPIDAFPDVGRDRVRPEPDHVRLAERALVGDALSTRLAARQVKLELLACLGAELVVQVGEHL